MTRENKHKRGKSNASTAQKQDVMVEKRIADPVAGKGEGTPPDRAAQVEQDAYRAGAPTYSERDMAQRSVKPDDGADEPELTDETTGATREPSALEEGIDALASEEAAGERTRYASDKAADELTDKRNEKT